jgi:hypothetical protein
LTADLGALIARMDELLIQLREQRDSRRFFHATYLRTTRAVAAELAEGHPGFDDAPWVTRWDLAFAEFYLDALAADSTSKAVPGPWAEAFRAATQNPEIPPLRHVLLGMNAHINFDLPQALLAVITEAEFDDPALLARRKADHRHIDHILARLVDSGNRLANGGSRLAMKRLLRKSRASSWANARVLDLARRRGEPAYRTTLDKLDRLVAARVTELVRPGPVLPRLAVRGFGVALTPSHHE